MWQFGQTKCSCCPHDPQYCASGGLSKSQAAACPGMVCMSNTADGPPSRHPDEATALLLTIATELSW
jgi:hypothetical protein